LQQIISSKQTQPRNLLKLRIIAIRKINNATSSKVEEKYPSKLRE
jgi:hypothetical protein